MEPNRKIKLFIFDMGGVLLQNFDVLPEICNILGVSQRDFIDQNGDQLFALEEGKLSTSNLWKNYSSRTGIPVDRELYGELFKPSVDVSTEHLIYQLKKNFRIICGTNTIKEHWEYFNQKGYYTIFDKVYASHIIHAAKPRKIFYEIILKNEMVLPEEAVFVDDTKKNVDAALELGLHGFLFKDVPHLIKEIKKLLPGVIDFN